MSGGIAERLCFAEDCVSFFMQLNGLVWTPGTNGEVWHRYHPRRFTRAMAVVAWNVLHYELTFTIDRNKKPTFKHGYYPGFFLQYCALVAQMAVVEQKENRRHVIDGIVIAITNYLGTIYEDNSFAAAKGWDGLEKYADDAIKKG